MLLMVMMCRLALFKAILGELMPDETEAKALVSGGPGVHGLLELN